MARSVATIQALIVTNFQAQPELAAANSTSKRAIWYLLTFIVATAINVFEQLLDLFKANITAIVALSAPATPQWLQAKIFNFQYSATNPQNIQLINTVPTYAVVDPTLLLITRASVKTSLANTVAIKAAKLMPPVALLAPELSALQSYINSIGIAGINYTVTSANPDQIFIQATVFYQGTYAAIILQSVTAAIATFLANLAFDGSMKVSDLENTIRNVTGVNDVVLQNVTVRRDQDTVAQGTVLIQNQTEVARLWATIAGYMVAENTAGYTLATTLTLTPQ